MINQAYHYSALHFRSARWDAMRTAVDDLLRQRPYAHTHVADVWTQLHVRDYIDRGLQSVATYKIVAIPGRYTDFEQVFSLPGQSSRLPQIGQRRASMSVQAPVELYKIGETYFVKDGNQRVTTARARGQLFLPAHVIEYVVDFAHANPEDTLELLLLEERAAFLEATELTTLRPNSQMDCAVLGNYPHLADHVLAYCSALSAEWERLIPMEIAAASWYDTMYLPIASEIRRHQLLEHFPDYAETDFYLWLMLQRINTKLVCQTAGDLDQPCAPANSSFRVQLQDALNVIGEMARLLR